MNPKIEKSFEDINKMTAGVIKKTWDFFVSLATSCGYCGVYNVSDYLKKYKWKFKFTDEDYVQIAKQFKKYYENFIDYGNKKDID